MPLEEASIEINGKKESYPVESKIEVNENLIFVDDVLKHDLTKISDSESLDLKIQSNNLWVGGLRIRNSPEVIETIGQFENVTIIGSIN